MMEELRQGIGTFTRAMWPGSFHGLEHLPEHGNFLVVANHSGMGSAELMALVDAWYERFGCSRPVAGMAHPAGFRVPVLSRLLQGVGAVEATRAGAAKARHHGVPLLLFPGGDVEASRPYWEADRVDFAGRKGWIHLAREHQLTIVPMCITGSHKTLPLLGGGRAAAWATGLRLLGVHRAPVPVLSVAAAACAFGLASAAGLRPAVGAGAAWVAALGTMMVPWVPSSIGFSILPPIANHELADPARDNDVYQRVVGALESTLRTRQAGPLA